MLIVSDTTAMLEILAAPLRQLGYQVLLAENALQAQRLADLRPEINLLLVDLAQPETNLVDLAAWVHATYPEVKVLMTANSFWDLNPQLAILREVSLLAKPFTAHELASMVRRVLD